MSIISLVVAGLATLKLPGCPPLFQSLSCSSGDNISHKARYPSLSTSISCHGTCWKLPENYCRRQFNAVPLAGAGSEKLLQFTQDKLELSLGGGHSKYLYKFFWLLSGSGSDGEHVLCTVSASFQSLPNSGCRNCTRDVLPGEHYYQFSFFSDFTSLGILSRTWIEIHGARVVCCHANYKFMF